MSEPVPFSKVAEDSKISREAIQWARVGSTVMLLSAFGTAAYGGVGYALTHDREYLTQFGVSAFALVVFFVFQYFVWREAARRSNNVIAAARGERRKKFADAGAYE